MPTRTQIDTFITNNKTQIRNFVENNLVNGRYPQIKKVENRDDVSVHEYEGPLGIGYLIQVTATEGQDVYNRTFHFGPETRPTDTGWVLQVDDII